MIPIKRDSILRKARSNIICTLGSVGCVGMTLSVLTSLFKEDTGLELGVVVKSLGYPSIEAMLDSQEFSDIVHIEFRNKALGTGQSHESLLCYVIKPTLRISHIINEIEISAIDKENRAKESRSPTSEVNGKILEGKIRLLYSLAQIGAEEKPVALPSLQSQYFSNFGVVLDKKEVKQLFSKSQIKKVFDRYMYKEVEIFCGADKSGNIFIKMKKPLAEIVKDFSEQSKGVAKWFDKTREDLVPEQQSINEKPQCSYVYSMDKHSGKNEEFELGNELSQNVSNKNSTSNFLYDINRDVTNIKKFPYNATKTSKYTRRGSGTFTSEESDDDDNEVDRRENEIDRVSDPQKPANDMGFAFKNKINEFLVPPSVIFGSTNLDNATKKPEIVSCHAEKYLKRAAKLEENRMAHKQAYHIAHEQEVTSKHAAMKQKDVSKKSNFETNVGFSTNYAKTHEKIGGTKNLHDIICYIIENCVPPCIEINKLENILITEYGRCVDDGTEEKVRNALFDFIKNCCPEIQIIKNLLIWKEMRICPRLLQHFRKEELVSGKSADRFLTKAPVFSVKQQSAGEAFSFVDYCNVRCVSGNGGDGHLSFLREYMLPFGGADGGNGGNGGHIIFKADAKVTDLSQITAIIKASHGQRGGGRCCHGKNAEHVIVPVPLNTLIKKPCSNHRALNEGILHELHSHDDIFIAARGGAGGHGNNFYLSNMVRKPITAEFGGKSEIAEYALEMRVMASAGLVGFPNAGKSSFLRVISRAKPKVASYPFTTLKAHIGMVLYDDFQKVAVADIPGLIEGAHQNIGLGFSFLRHVCRCKSIFYVLDYTLGDCRLQFDALKRELDLYNPELCAKRTVVLINKSDMIPNEAEKRRIQNMFSDLKERIFFVSAREKTGLEPVLIVLREIHDADADERKRAIEESKINSML